MIGRTVGSELLRAYIASGRRQADVADALSRRLKTSVHQATVSTWATGRHVPGANVMVALLRIAKIPLESWSEPLVEAVSQPPKNTGTEG